MVSTPTSTFSEYTQKWFLVLALLIGCDNNFPKLTVDHKRTRTYNARNIRLLTPHESTYIYAFGALKG